MSSRSLGSLTIDLIAKIAGFEQGMDKAARIADKRMKEIEKSVKRVGVIVGTALAGAVTTVGVQLNKMVREGQQIAVLSRLSGESAEKFQEWAVGAKSVGIEQEKLADILKDTQDKVGDFLQTGGGAMADFFEQIAPKVGVTAEMFRRLSGREALQLYADSLQKANVSQAEMAFYMEAIASDSTKLYPLLMNNGEGFEYWAEHARDAGAIMSGETLEATRRLDVEMQKMRITIDGLWKNALANLLPDIEELARLLNSSEFKNGFASIIKGAVEATRVLAQMAVTTANVTKFIGEEIAARAHGAAADDIVRLEQEAERIRKQLSTASNLGEAGEAVANFMRSKLGLPTTDELRKRLGDVYEMIDNYKSPTPSTGGSGFDPASIENVPFGGGNVRIDTKGQKDKIDRLAQSYAALMASMHQRIALFGKESEVARVTYEIEHGSLKGVSAALAEQALLRARQIDQMEEAHEAAQREARAEEEARRAREEGLKAGKELLADLQFELTLMRMNNAERATAIQLYGLTAEAAREYGDAIAEANRRIEEQSEQVRFMDNMRREFSGFITDVVTGTESISDAFKSMMDNIAAMITQMIAERWVEQLFGQQGTTGSGTSGGNWLGMIFGALFGGGKASGGWAAPNRMYEVNERGLEMATVKGRDYLLTGNSPVHITPNHRLGGGGGGNVTQNFYNPVMSNIQTDQQRAREEARKAQRATARLA